MTTRPMNSLALRKYIHESEVEARADEVRYTMGKMISHFTRMKKITSDAAMLGSLEFHIDYCKRVQKGDYPWLE